MDWRIHILGASGTGTTTLGAKLSEELCLPHFDADQYYWEKTDPPFTTKRSPEDRVAQLKKDLPRNWVLSGSMVSWGDFFRPHFTHVVFLQLPPSVRLERILARERERYGDRISEGGDMHAQHKDFLDWARRYDTGGMEVRSKVMHEHWTKDLHCPVVKLSSLSSADQLVAEFLRAARPRQK